MVSCTFIGGILAQFNDFNGFVERLVGLGGGPTGASIVADGPPIPGGGGGPPIPGGGGGPGGPPIPGGGGGGGPPIPGEGGGGGGGPPIPGEGGGGGPPIPGGGGGGGPPITGGGGSLLPANPARASVTEEFLSFNESAIL
jgi:hypothetical protein